MSRTITKLQNACGGVVLKEILSVLYQAGDDMFRLLSSVIGSMEGCKNIDDDLQKLHWKFPLDEYHTTAF